jgi:hypothetical protein
LRRSWMIMKGTQIALENKIVEVIPV